MLVYESSHRILATLVDIDELFQNVLTIARELTKTFETIYMAQRQS